RLETAGCEVIPNGVGRAYRASELMAALAGVDAIITGTDELTGEVIRNADRLKTIAKHGIGLETIDLAAARARGIVVSATPHASSDSVADLTLALLLAAARKVVLAHNSTAAGSWKAFTGMELRDKTLGIVGLGRIGQQVCRRAQGFGMQVIAHDPFPNQEFAAAHQVRFVALDELLATADVVTLHLPADQVSCPLLGAAELGRMKPGALLLNTARGALVDEAALAEALRSGHLAGIGVDAFVDEPPVGSPLLDLANQGYNIVLTPHIGGRTVDGLRRMGEMTIENVLCALHGKPPLYQVV
ncbi:MAG TPA: phosphoglycerate dehydrogenase, partial [Caldilineaceae bacterium]|nr:phosphoglycerate dehydrogenase [Caldilineaceae bacterium]